jgi:radical SAM superfamily enzyme YgiQ (UPF0313 family)
MRILFVYPSSLKKGFFLPTEKLLQRVPLTLAQLAALTPREHQVDIFYENRYDKVKIKEKYDLVGISCFTMHAPRAYEIADDFRKKGIPVVLGGYHPSSLPDESKQHADSVVVGEAELTWPQLLKDFQNDSMKPFYRQEKPVDPTLIPPARRDIIKGLLPVTDVQATRGCPNRCEYCAIEKVEGHHFRKRPIENVIEEIKSIKGSYFCFYDPSLTIDIDYTKSLFKEMIGLKKNFECHGNINILDRNDELLSLSKKAGCYGWAIGFESICQESLKSVGKVNKVEKYADAIKKIRKHGLGIRGLFMFGFDHDTVNIFQDTYKAMRDWKIDMATFSILTPLPGTRIYDRFEKENRILTKDWSKYDCGTVVFQPKHMTPEQLYNKTLELAKAYYSYSNVLQRTFESRNLDFPRFMNKFRFNFLIDKRFIKRQYGV